MDRIAFLLTSILGLALSAVYSFRCWRRGEATNVAVHVNVVLHSGGLVAAGFLIAGTLIPDFRASLSSLDLYVLIGGIAVGVVSAQGLRREFTNGSTAERGEGKDPPAAVPALAVVPAATAASGGDRRS